ncbi:hypothetical protein EJ03DRAFT_372016 [Teratosphaeria nubilosa]|uniref:Uncharacterized protein n=1 Tax=Teratosphaeria nubilosa TaxID=161662 RepID=A0A6G1LIL2_9PEZI|nr:hypothetical protein EJ03DRAFT_372016 [Teratosphaeria nubilosa]
MIEKTVAPLTNKTETPLHIIPFHWKNHRIRTSLASRSANINPPTRTAYPHQHKALPRLSPEVIMASQMDIDNQNPANGNLVYSIDMQSTNFVGEGRQLVAGAGGAQTGGGHVARPEDVRRGNESILQRAEFDQLVAREELVVCADINEEHEKLDGKQDGVHEILKSKGLEFLSRF